MLIRRRSLRSHRAETLVQLLMTEGRADLLEESQGYPTPKLSPGRIRTASR